MAKVLLIQRDDLLTFTNLSGNIDTDKVRQYVAIAQDVHIERYLGTDLLAKIQSDISGSTLTGNYLTLVNTWVKPALIHWTMVELLPHLAITVGNGGLFRHEPENGTALTSEEVNDLVSQEKDFAVHYTNRLIDYLCNNSNLFPEYTTNTNEDVSPASDTTFCGWALN